MFDPVTEAFIRQARPLAGYENLNLAAELTRVYTWLVTVRLRSQIAEPDETAADAHILSAPAAPAEEIRRLRRLATTYESFALLQSPGSSERAASAFVSATAHQLLARALRLGEAHAADDHHVTASHISPLLSSCLLYLIAGYPSDAAQVGQELPRANGQSPRAFLERALGHLVRGELTDVSNLGQEQYELRAGGRDPNPVRAAADVLYNRLTRVIVRTVEMLHDQEVEAPANSLEELDRLIELSIEPASDDFLTTVASIVNENEDTAPSRRPIISSFGGPYHLARLLRGAIEALQDAAVVTIPPPIGIEGNRWREYRKGLARRRPYLWPNHKDAVDQGYLNLGTSAVITFPTGAGKSTLAELKIASALGAGRNVIYLAPTHALSGQTARELRIAFPSAEVINSLAAESEYSEVDDSAPAEISVMTPERCLTLLSVAPEMFANVGVVVFDECHLLHGGHTERDRRSLDAMLCILSLFQAAPTTDFLLLSAMVENGGELANWMQWATGRPCLALELDWKPTRQARSCIVFRRTDVIRASRKLEHERLANAGENRSPIKAVRERVGATPYALFGLTHSWTQQLTREQYSVQRILNQEISLASGGWRELRLDCMDLSAALSGQLARHDIRTLTFVHQRKSCASMLADIHSHLEGYGLPRPSIRASHETLFNNAAIDLGSNEAVAIDLQSYVDLHHGLLLTHERRLAELRFADPEGTRVLVATGTVAQGMNLPAEAVVIGGTKRWQPEEDEDEDDEDGSWRPVGAEELLNAAGRAGRAGRQSTGLAFLVPEFVVTLNDQGQPGPTWSGLFQSVFSKRDRCLTVDDPINAIIDRITVNDPGIPARNLRYFINRVPIQEIDGVSSVSMLRRSLGAYRASRDDRQADFEARIGLVPGVQAALAQLVEDRPDLIWLDTIAWKLGLPVRTVRGLFERTQNYPLPVESTIRDWLTWVFQWFGQSPEDWRELIRPSAMKAALTRDQQDEFKVSDYSSIEPLLPAIEGFCVKWLNGEPLCNLEELLNPRDARGKRRRRGYKQCDSGRRFALRFTVQLSYAVGAVALVIREHGLSGIDFDVPSSSLSLSLSVAASCIREGVNSPEALAARYYLGPTTPRKQALDVVEDHRGTIGTPEPTTPFPELRKRVASILRAAGVPQGPE